MIVLSLFDGMACGREALMRAGVPVTKYYASEIDRHAIKVAKANHNDITHLGDVRHWPFWDIEQPDIIIAGTPCQDFSIARTALKNKRIEGQGRTHYGACNNITDKDTIGCLTTNQDRCPNSGLIKYGDFCRYLSREEMELAQTLPPGYTAAASYKQAGKMLGNGWTVDVVAHIFRHSPFGPLGALQ